MARTAISPCPERGSGNARNVRKLTNFWHFWTLFDPPLTTIPDCSPTGFSDPHGWRCGLHGWCQPWPAPSMVYLPWPPCKTHAPLRTPCMHHVGSLPPHGASRDLPYPPRGCQSEHFTLPGCQSEHFFTSRGTEMSKITIFGAKNSRKSPISGAKIAENHQFLVPKEDQICQFLGAKNVTFC